VRLRESEALVTVFGNRADHPEVISGRRLLGDRDGTVDLQTPRDKALVAACFRLARIELLHAVSQDLAEMSASDARDRRPQETLTETMRVAIVEALDDVAWNVSAAARQLGMSRTGLIRRMDTLGVSRTATPRPAEAMWGPARQSA
jgi:DNA-binding NtrC family response regulator